MKGSLPRRAHASALLACVLLLSRTPPLRAALPAECQGLGPAITEHSCFHSEFGPFTSVQATAGAELGAATPDVSAVHTEYRIGLGGEYSAVRYTPKRAGHWAVLLSSDVPLDVLAGPAQALAPLLTQQGETGCAALPVLRVFQLDAGVEHRLVFGPTAARQVVIVIEYIDDFLTENGADDDGDGFGSSAQVVVSPCAPPAGFAPNARDCDDTDAAIHPDAVEHCDGVDQNCNGSADDAGLVCRSGVGGCRREGVVTCERGASMASCSASPGEAEPEQCNGVDDDCDGATDEPAAETEQLCEADAPACVRRGSGAFCGCLLDLDCGAADSGVACDQKTGRCKAGCSTAAGRNGCPVGFSCDEVAASCVADQNAAGGAGGNPAGPDTAEAGATVSDGPTGAGGASSGNGSGSGCGCRAAGHSGASRAWITMLMLGALAAARRGWGRSCGRSLILVTSLLPLASACGGRVIAEGVDSGGVSSSGAPALPPAAGAAGVGGESACQPALTKQAVLHACSHANHGPYLAIVSTSGGDVSELHRTYEVQAVAGEGKLRYRAQRGGEHAFMTSVPVALELRRAGVQAPQAPEFPVEGCSALTYAVVYSLKAGEEYSLASAESGSTFLLFVEHLGAFEQDGWAKRCAPDG